MLQSAGEAGAPGDPNVLGTVQVPDQKAHGKENQWKCPSKHQALGDSDGEKYKVRAAAGDRKQRAVYRQQRGAEARGGDVSVGACRMPSSNEA